MPSRPPACLSVAYGVIRAARNAGLAFLLLAGSVWAEPVTIAALGDSLTQGYGLVPEHGFVPRMEARLRDLGADVVLVNAGVSGDTTAGGLSRIEWTLTPEVDGLIVALGGNDLLRGIDPAVSRENLDGILGVAADRGLPVLLVGMSAPSNYGADFKSAFDGMYGDLAEIHGALLYPDFLGALTGMADRVETLETYFQTDRIHPNAAGVELIVRDMAPSVLKLVEIAAGNGG